MARTPAHIKLTDDEIATLKEWCQKDTSEQRIVERARIILLSHEGFTVENIAKKLGTRPARVSKWRQRFAKERLAALFDAPRSGKPQKYTADTERRVLALLKQGPPKGYVQWNGALLAASLEDVSTHQVWRILRKHGIQLQRQRSWFIYTYPEFGPKAADIVGLYLDAHEKALVLCVDEKPHVQASMPGYLRMPNKKAAHVFNRCYKRHGTQTLFAALDVAASQVTGPYTRQRRREFLDFMNELVVKNAGREMHVILDNLTTHKPERDRWLKVHPVVHPHFTPTYSSWLNQVECWFSILSRSRSGDSVTSARQVCESIDAFVKREKATPFEWTKATCE